MTNEERESIRQAAERNADRYWEVKTNTHDPRDIRAAIFDSDYKTAGGKN